MSAELKLFGHPYIESMKGPSDIPNQQCACRQIERFDCMKCSLGPGWVCYADSTIDLEIISLYASEGKDISDLLREWLGSPESAADLKQLAKNLPYRDFLKTRYWNWVRTIVAVRADNRCQVCNHKGSINVHHRSYEHHGEEHLHLDDLVALCFKCHKMFHERGYLYRG